jgi:hypothetical protein
MCAPAQEVIGGGQILGCDAQIGGVTRRSTVLIKLGFSTCEPLARILNGT